MTYTKTLASALYGIIDLIKVRQYSMDYLMETEEESRTRFMKENPMTLDDDFADKYDGWKGKQND